MSVKYSIEEIFDLDEPYIPSKSVRKDKERLHKALVSLDERRKFFDSLKHLLKGESDE